MVWQIQPEANVRDDHSIDATTERQIGQAALLQKISIGRRKATEPQTREEEVAVISAVLQDFDTAAVSVAEQQLPVGYENAERSVEVPSPIRFALAAHHDTFAGLRSVSGFGADERIDQAIAGDRDLALAP